MIVEAEPKPGTTHFPESKEEPVFSRHPLLDQKLNEVARNLAGLPERGVTLAKVPDLIGFGNEGYEVRQIVVGVIHSACVSRLFNREIGEHSRTKYRFEKNRLMLSRAIVEFWAQQVSPRNMPYVLAHYLTDPELRGAINKPTVKFDPENRITGSGKFLERQRQLRSMTKALIPPGAFDFDQRTILADIPFDLTSSLFDFEKSKRNLQPEQLGAFFWLLSNSLKFPSEDSISSTRLIGSGFTIADAETVLKYFATIKGQNAGDLDVTGYPWRILKKALKELILSNASIDLEMLSYRRI